MAQFGINATLTSVEWTSDYSNVRDWNSVSGRSNYFANLPSKTISFSSNNLAQIRKNQTLIIATSDYGETPTDDLPSLQQLETVNYMYFNQDGRDWFYFITSVEYIGVHQCALTLNMDVWQTYYFDFNILPSLVKRGHVRRYENNGTPNFKYCDTPENIDVGEDLDTEVITILQNPLKSNVFDIDWLICVSTEPVFRNQTTSVWEYGITFYIAILPVQKTTAFSQIYWQHNDTGGITTLASYNTFMSEIKSNQAVVNVYYSGNMPFPYTVKKDNQNRYIVDVGEGNYINFTTFNLENEKGYVIAPLIGDSYAVKAKSIVGTFEQYLNYELKAGCFPYSYYVLSKNRGNYKIIKPQYCNHHNREGLLGCTAYGSFIIAMSCGSYLTTGYTIDGYLGDNDNNLYADLSSDQLPTISDAYLNFLQTQKAAFTTGIKNAKREFLGDVIMAAATIPINQELGALRGVNLIGSGISLYNKMQMAEAKIRDLKDTPDSVKSSGTDVTFEMICNTTKIMFLQKRIKPLHMQRLLNHFNMFGYTINDIFDIKQNKRKYFNYIEYISANITGNISASVKRTIKNILDTGLTIWHEGSKMYDYTQQNDEVY